MASDHFPGPASASCVTTHAPGQGSFIISRQYGALLDGYNRTDAELKLLLGISHPSEDQRERMHMFLAERDEWRACMDRCPMFVQGEGRAHG